MKGFRTSCSFSFPELSCRKGRLLQGAVRGGPKQVLRYLSRYTHRVAISNSRLIALDDASVTFKWKILWGGG